MLETIKKLFERRLYKTIAVATVALGIFLIVLVATKSYAVAEVNGTAVSVNQFKLNYVAANSYYSTLKNEYEKNNQKIDDLADKDIRADILNQLIEATIIGQGLQKEAGDEAEELVAKRIEEFTDDNTLATAAKNLYGFSSADFTREVLIPQAKMDILRGRLFLKNEDFKTWLADAKKSADVKIFSNDYTWNGEKVSAK